MEPGDLLVFDSHLMHRSTDNVSDEIRAAHGLPRGRSGHGRLHRAPQGLHDQRLDACAIDRRMTDAPGERVRRAVGSAEAAALAGGGRGHPPHPVGGPVEPAARGPIVEHRSPVVRRLGPPAHRAGRPEPRPPRRHRVPLVHRGDPPPPGRAGGPVLRDGLLRQRPRVQRARPRRRGDRGRSHLGGVAGGARTFPTKGRSRSPTRSGTGCGPWPHRDWWACSWWPPRRSAPASARSRSGCRCSVWWSAPCWAHGRLRRTARLPVPAVAARRQRDAAVPHQPSLDGHPAAQHRELTRRLVGRHALDLPSGPGRSTSAPSGAYCTM